MADFKDPRERKGRDSDRRSSRRDSDSKDSDKREPRGRSSDRRSPRRDSDRRESRGRDSDRRDSDDRPRRDSRDRPRRDRRDSDRRSFGRRDSGRRDSGRGRDNVEMTKVTCSACGDECEVPFKPQSNKPLFCDKCFAKNGGGRSSRDFGGDRRGRSSDSSNRDMKEINEKLNKIMEALDIK